MQGKWFFIFASFWNYLVVVGLSKLTLLLEISLLNSPLALWTHFERICCLETMAALLNMLDTWMSKSLGTAMPLLLATSDKVWMQFSTLVFCSRDNQLHWETLKAALKSWTKIGCRLCKWRNGKILNCYTSSVRQYSVMTWKVKNIYILNATWFILLLRSMVSSFLVVRRYWLQDILLVWKRSSHSFRTFCYST